VLGDSNRKRVVEAHAKRSAKHPDMKHLFWHGDGFVCSGIISGPGFLAYADDFPEGTVIRVTAEIIEPEGAEEGEG
jgi:hypothetical protein